ncbi:AAA family ATPase [Archangium lansingense]|uniref:AAA family ATPase n=1 Tax=Archangium lansingense TaxID=2995310 RepID=A0ABT4AP50_9BACT|nr:AAA family ATPase [Archangium lansinium]MCY1083475.1 AAA family ATPase [Archangium lansinium]
MRLKSLTFEDKRTGWRLENLRLDRFNLLVGASGVGKTRILRAIQTVRNLGRGVDEPYPKQGVRFDVRFEHEERDYAWQFDSAARDLAPGEDEEGDPLEDSSSVVLSERLHISDEGLLVERNQDRFLFRSTELPTLNRSSSALQLLDEPSIHHLRQAFAEYFSSAMGAQGSTEIVNTTPGPVAKGFPTLESFRGLTGLHPVVKAFILQEGSAERFERFKQLFIDIFPTVEDVRVDRRATMGLGRRIREYLSFKLKERGVPTWIEARDISSGMARTLNHLVDLMLAPAGTVFLIDEFENSLGVNCMGPLTDFILSRADDLQFIITSHHPYIINNIPKSYWKLVRRKGSTVRVTPASEIPALQGPSAQDDFIRLINSPEFEEGME